MKAEPGKSVKAEAGKGTGKGKGKPVKTEPGKGRAKGKAPAGDSTARAGGGGAAREEEEEEAADERAVAAYSRRMAALRIHDAPGVDKHGEEEDVPEVSKVSSTVTVTVTVTVTIGTDRSSLSPQPPLACPGLLRRDRQSAPCRSARSASMPSPCTPRRTSCWWRQATRRVISACGT